MVTGANGFIGKNLVVHLSELPNITVSTFVRGSERDSLSKLVEECDAVVHLAGENRPANDDAFTEVNSGLTSELCAVIQRIYNNTGRHVPMVLTSSIQVELDNPYGRSKLLAERAVYDLAEATGNPCIVFRLPGVFGKWCKPNYNSVVATFCHNRARGLPIHVNEASARLRLVYVDDVVSALLDALSEPAPGWVQAHVTPEYITTLGELAAQIETFVDGRNRLTTERVGSGFVRALYATYVSYLPKELFAYEVPQHTDSRGVFVEMLKTLDSGQFSYFTAHSGVTRGGHYHHTKTEKFLVIKGKALFKFRHLLTDECYELYSCGEDPLVVDTIPGWTHDITNVGTDEMVVLLWANENYDRLKPDTVASKI